MSGAFVGVEIDWAERPGGIARGLVIEVWRGGIAALPTCADRPRPDTRAEFDRLYGGDAYRAAKARYDPDARLLDLYAKAVQRR